MLKGVGAIFAACVPDGTYCLSCFSNMAVLRVRRLFAVFLSYKTRSQCSRYGTCSQDAWNKFFSQCFIIPLPPAFHQYSIHRILYILLYIFIHLQYDPSGRSVQDLVVRPLAYWYCEFETRRGRECVLWVLCAVRFSYEKGRSLVQRSPTEGVVSKCDLKPQQWGSQGPIGLSIHRRENIRLQGIYRPQLLRDVTWHFRKKIKTSSFA
jgi:hypothetical protein